MSERNCQRRDKKEAVSGVLSVAAYALGLGERHERHLRPNERAAIGSGLFPAGRLAGRPPFRAVNGNKSSGGASVYVVRLDEFDYEIESVGAVDLAGDAVALAWRDGASW
jgi:hypothetical protein